MQEVDPPTPSRRLEEGREKGSRRSQPRDGVNLIDSHAAIADDLDWIVMKSLEKDRRKALRGLRARARDIRRFLDSDPVEARPPSAVYRFNKGARKHRVAFATAAAVLFFLSGSSVVSTRLMLRARWAERVSKRALDDMRKAQARSRSEAEKAQAVNNFLVQDLLSQAEPAKNAVEDLMSTIRLAADDPEGAGEPSWGQRWTIGRSEDFMCRIMSGSARRCRSGCTAGTAPASGTSSRHGTRRCSFDRT